MKKLFWILFFTYCAVLAEILLLGRSACTDVPVKEYFMTYANPVPLRTLIRYVSFFVKRKDLHSFRLAFSNIMGNFLLFLPMGFCLPVLLGRRGRFRRSFWVILATVFFTELFQGLFRVGIPDIDDLTVNMAGAYLGILLSGHCFFTKAANRR